MQRRACCFVATALCRRKHGCEQAARPYADRAALAESLAGKDRYEFEKFFGTTTALTLSESVYRFINRRQAIHV
jgi:hypothetical protein